VIVDLADLHRIGCSGCRGVGAMLAEPSFHQLRHSAGVQTATSWRRLDLDVRYALSSVVVSPVSAVRHTS
jgi:hypothetical protein